MNQDKCVLKLGVFPLSGCADGDIGIDSVERRVAEALSEGCGTSGFHTRGAASSRTMSSDYLAVVRGANSWFRDTGRLRDLVVGVGRKSFFSAYSQIQLGDIIDKRTG